MRSVVVGSGHVDYLEIPVTMNTPECDHADILDEGGDEGLVGIDLVFGLDHLGQRACDTCTEERTAPVLVEVETDFVPVVAIGDLHQAEPEHETLDGLESEKGDRLSDVATSSGQSVVARVDGSKNPGGHRLVTLDGLFDLTKVDIIT